MKHVRNPFTGAVFGVLLGLLSLGPIAQATTTLQNVRLDFLVKALYTNDLSPVKPEYSAEFRLGDLLTDGNSVDKAETVYFKDDTVAASATKEYDLAGSLTDAFGNTMTFTKLKCLVVWNKSTTAGDILNVRQGTSVPANGVPFLGANGNLVKLGPNGVFIWYVPSAAAVTVTAATGDLVDIVETGGANTVSFQVLFIGTDS